MKLKKHHEVVVNELPYCDICSEENNHIYARYDARLKTGQWANLCEKHFKQYTIGKTGLGLGQRLYLPGEKK